MKKNKDLKVNTYYEIDDTRFEYKEDALELLKKLKKLEKNKDNDIESLKSFIGRICNENISNKNMISFQYRFPLDSNIENLSFNTDLSSYKVLKQRKIATMIVDYFKDIYKDQNIDFHVHLKGEDVPSLIIDIKLKNIPYNPNAGMYVTRNNCINGILKLMKEKRNL